jgi:DNA-binding XRE family transcriptional regulator
MLPNEEFALACRAYYEEQGLIVDATNGQFAHCPLPKGMGETGYYLLWEHHQQQGLLQSRDVGKCCFFAGHVKFWLQSWGVWPNNFFELWDIYEEFTRKNGERVDNLRKPEVLQKAANSRRRWFNSPAGLKHQELLRGLPRGNAREVKVTFEDGREEIYSNCRAAAQTLNVSPASVTNWARGKYRPSLNLTVNYI